MSLVRRIRAVEVVVAGVTLSGLVAEPDREPRALVEALHGHGMTARYFSDPVDADLSLLEFGASLGFVVWAPDRSGYGACVGVDPSRLAMFAQGAF